MLSDSQVRAATPSPMLAPANSGVKPKGKVMHLSITPKTQQILLGLLPDRPGSALPPAERLAKLINELAQVAEAERRNSTQTSLLGGISVAASKT